MLHWRRWGAVYILAVLTVGFLVGQWHTMAAAAAEAGGELTAAGFWSTVFENWQSETGQLIVQAVLLLALKHRLFQADAEDLERLEYKIDQALGLLRERRVS
jgi:hypothetical protein